MIPPELEEEREKEAGPALERVVGEACFIRPVTTRCAARS